MLVIQGGYALQTDFFLNFNLNRALFFIIQSKKVRESNFLTLSIQVQLEFNLGIYIYYQ